MSWPAGLAVASGLGHFNTVGVGGDGFRMLISWKMTRMALKP